MAALTTNTISSTYTMLLKTTSVVDGTLRYIEDGAGTNTTLKVSTGAISIDAADKLYLDAGNNTYIHEASSDRLDFVVGGDVDALVLLESGSSTNVGIGTNAPLASLMVERAARTTVFDATDSDTYSDIIVRNPTDTINAATGIKFTVDASTATGAGAGIAGVKSHASNQQMDLVFITDPSGTTAAERMRILHTGYVGIGTTTPEAILHINDSADNDDVVAISLVNTDYEAEQTGQSVSISGGVMGASSTLVSCGKILFGKDDNFDDADAKDGHIAFHTRLSNTQAEKMRITSDGNVGIGTTDPDAPLHVSFVGDEYNDMYTAAIFGGKDDTDDHDVNFSINVDTSGYGTMLANNLTWSDDVATQPNTGRSSCYFSMSNVNVSAGQTGLMTFGGCTDGSTTLVERMRIDNDGNVGIGTTAPGVKLQVNDSGNNDDVIAISLVNTDYEAAQTGQSVSISGGVMAHSSTLVSCGKILFGKDDDFDNDGAKDGYIAFHTRLSNTQAEKMRIDSDGNVGIGTIAPTNQLHIKSANPSMMLERTDAGAIAIYFRDTAANSGAITYDHSDNHFSIRTAGVDDRFYIDSAGDVGIGTSSPDTALDVEDNVDGGSVVTFKNTHSTIVEGDNILALQFSGDNVATEGNFIIFSDGNTAEMGVIKANSGSVVLDEYSDYRIKNTIATLSGGLNRVNALRPVTFKYNSDLGNATHEGFIAHEVQEHIPYAVRGVKDAMKTKVTQAVAAVEAKAAVLDGDGNIVEEAVEAVAAVAEKTEEVIKAQSFCIYQLIPQMVSAIQELSAKVTALENA